MSTPSVAVVGAGIVGLAAAYYLRKEGARVTVIDRDPEGDKASFGNAGGIAVTEVIPASVPGTLWRVWGWMSDPLGPLAVRPSHAPKLIPWLTRFAKVGTAAEVARISAALSAINQRVYEDLLPLLGETGLMHHLHRTGALSVYETESGFRRDATEWAQKRALGVIAEEMSGEEARSMEPALGPLVSRAVFTPQWSIVSDPKRIVDELRAWLSRNGVAIRKGDVRDVRTSPTSPPVLTLAEGDLTADLILIAAGAWSKALARSVGDPVLLESERGYNMTIPQAGITLTRQLTFAERKFVATPLSCGLRIGGAAEFGGLNAVANFERSQALVSLARRYLPQLESEGGLAWAGHRPATPDSLPVIGRSKHEPKVFYAFGHGHLGLTQAATTGRLVTDLMFHGTAAIDMTPYSIERFA